MVNESLPNDRAAHQAHTNWSADRAAEQGHAVNAGRERYEEIVTFLLDRPDQDPQPRAESREEWWDDQLQTRKQVE
jgi:hypothetical protein